MRRFHAFRARGARTPSLLFATALVLASAPLASPSPAEPIRVLIVGDSLSGKGAKYVNGDGPETSFASQLELDLGDAYEFTNVSCPGASALDWSLSTPGILCPPLAWYENPNGLLKERALSELPVDLAIVLLGTNDALGIFEPSAVPAEAYGVAIGEIVDALLAGGARQVMLITPPDLPSFPDLPGGEGAHLLIQAYREEILALCGQSEKRICGPDFSTLLDLELDFSDGNPHPNARGHARMAEAVGAAILQISKPPTRDYSLLAIAVLVLLVVVPVFVVRKRTSSPAPPRTP